MKETYIRAKETYIRVKRYTINLQIRDEELLARGLPGVMRVRLCSLHLVCVCVCVHVCVRAPVVAEEEARMMLTFKFR